MSRKNRPIDAHVHLYTAADLARVGSGLPYALPEPHPLGAYLDALIDAGTPPTLVNNVHLSILPDSENVFASFDELAALRARDPARYGDIQLTGTIKADPGYADAVRLSHPQVRGVRIVLHDAPPETVAEDAYAGDAWRALFARMRPDQHIHVYAQEAETNLRTLRQMPAGIRVVIDHLGTCRPERGVDEPAYAALLEEARRRGDVWFKGPGYRTGVDPEAVAPFALRIVETLGPERVLLQASDAPHVGNDEQGRPYAEHFTPSSALAFTERLAEIVARRAGADAEALLRGAATELFPAP